MGVPERLVKPALFRMVFMPMSRQRLANRLSINTPFALSNHYYTLLGRFSHFISTTCVVKINSETLVNNTEQRIDELNHRLEQRQLDWEQVVKVEHFHVNATSILNASSH